MEWRWPTESMLALNHWLMIKTSTMSLVHFAWMLGLELFSIKPLKVKRLAGEQKATEMCSFVGLSSFALWLVPTSSGCYLGLGDAPCEHQCASVS